MKVTAVFDVLSHWCLAAWPAFEASRKKAGVSNVELFLAPIENGFPMGMPPEHERWFYTRGSRAYDMQLHADWYENDRTTTLWANAAVVAAAALGADLAETAYQAMSAAMESGALLGRRDVAVRAIAEIVALDPALLDAQIDKASTGKALNAGNERLMQWNCAERPSWRIENANGDFVVMQGMWRADPILACIDGLAADERAYAAAGAPPG